MNGRALGYWITTGLFCAVLGFSGFAHFTQQDMMVEGMTHLGYPLYVMRIIGLAKLLGVVAVLVPGNVLLKEWAYSGLAFNLIGATASHLFAGDPLVESIAPAIVLCIGLASYLLRPNDRRMPGTPALGGVI